MPRILYVFPHPDDESFGPAPVLARQRREGHEVHLLTLTRGEATQARHRHNLSKEEMGVQRYREMRGVARVLDLTSLVVLDLPDGELDDLDAMDLDAAVRTHLERVRPDVVVTYAVHGISGHPDHIVSHEAVKRAFCAARRDGGSYLRRLAFYTLHEDDDAGRPDHLQGSPAEAVDCVVAFDDEDHKRAERALDCYVTYRHVIEEHQPLQAVANGVPFELYREAFDPPLGDLFARLP